MNYKNSMQENGSPIESQNDDFTNTSSTIMNIQNG